MSDKRTRNKLSKAELWMHLAVSAGSWATMLRDGAATEAKVAAGGKIESFDTPPVSRWGLDDPMVVLMRTYNLTATELARICDSIADEIEGRAIRGGYDDHWDEA